MIAVCFVIRDIVDDVNHPGQQTEDNKPGGRDEKNGQVVQPQLAVEDQRRIDDQVLGPLARPHGNDDCGERFNQHAAMIA